MLPPELKERCDARLTHLRRVALRWRIAKVAGIAAAVAVMLSLLLVVVFKGMDQKEAVRPRQNWNCC